MAVIINTLEVIVEPATPLVLPGEATPPAPAPQLAPQDLIDVAERRARLAARLAAH